MVNQEINKDFNECHAYYFILFELHKGNSVTKGYLDI